MPRKAKPAVYQETLSHPEMQALRLKVASLEAEMEEAKLEKREEVERACRTSDREHLLKMQQLFGNCLLPPEACIIGAWVDKAAGRIHQMHIVVEDMKVWAVALDRVLKRI